jgi:hypothetical protein
MLRLGTGLIGAVCEGHCDYDHIAESGWHSRLLLLLQSQRELTIV